MKKSMIALSAIFVLVSQASYAAAQPDKVQTTKKATSLQKSDQDRHQAPTRKDVPAKDEIKLITEFKTKVDPAYAKKIQSAASYVEKVIIPNMVKNIGNPKKVKQTKIVIEQEHWDTPEKEAEAFDGGVTFFYSGTKNYVENQFRNVIIHEMHHILTADKHSLPDNLVSPWPHWLVEGLADYEMLNYAKQYGGEIFKALPTKKEIAHNPIDNSYLSGYQYAVPFIQYLEEKSPGTIRFFYNMKSGDDFQKKFKQRFKQDPTSIWFKEFLGQKENIVFEEKGKATTETKKVEQEIRRMIQQYLPTYIKMKNISAPFYLKTIFQRTSQEVTFQIITSDIIQEKQFKYSDLDKWLSDKIVKTETGQEVKVEDFLLNNLYISDDE
ncbi:basic secretory protein-like protein [Baia soyae]|uniref:Basic secretory peptidase family protein n=1 Tax=Baia soyae TaxID=1544746 RepID=A0A4R2RJD4_9BACL|nr:basic secretory protein-like protein [Baia soyae]TCP63930.1 basic secretory peptidase family protein [Baia soyae]